MNYIILDIKIKVTVGEHKSDRLHVRFPLGEIKYSFRLQAVSST